MRVREVLSRCEDSPERHDALRVAADKLDLPRELQAGLAPRTRRVTGAVSPKVLDAGHRLEMDVLAACVRHPELVPLLVRVSPDHFDSDVHRRVRAQLVEEGDAPDELLPVLAELDARADAEALEPDVGKELLLRLRERRLRRELASADLERTKELQAALARIREAAAGAV